MLISVFLLVCCVYLGVKPPVSLIAYLSLKMVPKLICIKGGTGFTASNFFQYILGLLIIFGFTIGYKVIYRTPWRDSKTADCKTGRRHLDVDEIAMLDSYYRQPAWRRFFTYVQLW